MRKIGILGGTFNPIHNGHLLLAETARQACGLSEVIFMPSGCSYMKDPKEILPGALRLSMVQLAIQDNPSFSASSMEVERKGNSYTCDTLKELHALYPADALYHIVGADSLFRMELWKNPEAIFQNSITLAAVREGYADEKLKQQAVYLSQKYGCQVLLLPSCHMEISSTQIRNNCRKGASIRYLVPEALRTFIEEKGLYR